MSLLQKCWQFLVNHFEDNHSLTHFELTATQWKALVREHLTPIIEKELQVKQIADFVWARTDKSIYTHVYELSKDFYNSDGTNRKKREAYDKTIVSRYFVIEKTLKMLLKRS